MLQMMENDNHCVTLDRRFPSRYYYTDYVCPDSSLYYYTDYVFPDSSLYYYADYVFPDSSLYYYADYVFPASLCCVQFPDGKHFKCQC